jgi:excisionase family DNA binding protein
MASRSAPTPFLTIAETAEYLTVSKLTVSRLLKAGRLSSVKLGRRTLVRKSAVDALVRAGARP